MDEHDDEFTEEDDEPIPYVLTQRGQMECRTPIPS